MFGADITPNEHALARQFGVLDNFYDSGEVSGNGHVWSNAAITSDYTEKTWQLVYRGNERSYDYEGMVALDYPIKIGIPDVNEPGTGYLWTNVARHGKTYRHYGEYISTRFCDRGETRTNPQQGTPLPMPESCPQAVVKPGEPFPPNLADRQGRTESVAVADSVGRGEHRDQARTRGPLRSALSRLPAGFPDQLRVDEWLREFRPWVEEPRRPAKTTCHSSCRCVCRTITPPPRSQATLRLLPGCRQ